ncbi:hypothetical protein A2803_02670 [Candidatus Woesebacteria bacterium RIFCSPHIGHO2_01_FULL_44_21]|uniref:Glycosyltransferase RgtA/B/C/D-like domain-containing protein n=1 Tax=Candidatus Woesebacteria bacterium RIFCSPHIGHO2_01_FULL_44_21 TaxID=1802503 RepID=A0A1F7YZ13_9BACT|nr:MAG: hypothetical protein A2803_02670 [Candidatus Woesebacteria bacterium RIFCSPHIGHO2_01_FULL_44_21]OGM69824.1 MAG: hypothetical protein A2897_00575 [Candidatus Woesebacteria bacterium RIFCSPLOWO2_01_FULL_44_24b]
MRLSKYLEKLGSSLRAEVLSHKFVYLLLGVILVLALFIRVYNTGKILGFYYDQGRDALEIWELLHKGDVFLIGPTTGIAGIFRGPYYYYLIAPLYLLGGGDPVLPANFLAFTTVIAIALIYYLGFKLKDRTTGLFAAAIASFSFYIMLASRWLSNPTPMLLLSMLLLWALFAVSEGKKYAWIAVSLLAGLSLFHFGSSGEFFYFPAIALFAVWQKKHFPNGKIIFYSIVAFGFTAAPLILFDFKNDHLLSRNIYSFIFEKESFKTSFMQVLSDRIDFYQSVFWGRLFPGTSRLITFSLLTVGVGFFLYLPDLLKNTKAKILMLMLLSPIVGLLFFQGNEGNIYDYYMTGYYLIFILLFAVILGHLWGSVAGKIVVFIFFYAFFTMNLPIVKAKITDNADGPNTILFRNQKQAIEWVYGDAKEEFNVDVYVPPVIPYAYDYLFTWYEGKPEYSGKVSDNRELLYTLYEEDPPHPERLEAWLARQKGIAEVEYAQKFGGITVERRKRVK